MQQISEQQTSLVRLSERGASALRSFIDLIHRTPTHKRVLMLLLVLLISLLPTLGAAPMAFANPANVTISITPIAAPNFIVDSNVLSPSTYAPRAATLGATFCNTGTETATDVVGYIGDYTNSTTFTPGTYPQRPGAGGETQAQFNALHPHLTGTGPYSLTHEAGSGSKSDDATRFIGTLAPGACSTQYWLISYPNKSTTGTVSVTGGSIKPHDDLYLHYDLWATARDSVGAVDTDSTSLNNKVTMRNEISAAANKIWPNGTNKVPAQYLAAIAAVAGWDTFVPGGGNNAYPGQTVTTQGIWYDFGNVGEGFDNNGDGIPDHNAWMQPVGDAPSFNAGCLRLVRTYGIVIVKLKGGGEYLIPFENQLYFENIPDNTGAVGLVYYEYAALNGACSVSLSPYQEVASGRDNEKFSGDYGFPMEPMQTAAPTLPIDKTVNGAQANSTSANSVLTYTIAFQNNTNTGAPLNQFVTIGGTTAGTQLSIEDTIPPDTTLRLNASSPTLTLNNVTLNASLYTVQYKIAGVWTSVAPCTNCEAPTVQAIRWVLNSGIPGSTNGTNIYRATFEAIVDDGTGGEPIVAPAIYNTATSKIGPTTLSQDTTTSLLPGTSTISGFVFPDNSSSPTSNANNGTRDAGETTGLEKTNAVSLYYNAGGGNYVLWGTANTNASGAYSFPNLPAGNWEVRVNSANVTTAENTNNTGWANTSPSTIAITGLTVGGTSANNNFGFNSPLSITKSLTSSSPATQGSLVTFNVSATNNVNLITTASTCSYDVWANTRIARLGSGSEWVTSGVNPLNGTSGGNANGVYTGWDGNNDKFAANTWIGQPVGVSGAITRVDVLFSGQITGTWPPPQSGYTLGIELYNGATNIVALTDFPNTGVQAGYVDGLDEIDGFTDNAPLTTPPTGSPITLEMRSVTIPSVAHTMFTGTGLTMQFVSNKGSSNTNDNGYARGVGFRVFYDCTTSSAGSQVVPESNITTLSLFDTYDADLLQFVSASVAPSSVVITGTAPNTVGTINWNNAGPLNTAQTTTIALTFRALGTTGSTTNTFGVNNGSTTSSFSSGRATNDPTDATANVSFAAGTLPAGAISGTIWEDLDSDGTFDSVEPTISNVGVYLDTDNDGVFDAGEPIAYTNSSGVYSFTNLATSLGGISYNVRSLPSTLPTLASGSWTQTGEGDASVNNLMQPSLTNAAPTSTGRNFGYTRPTQAPVGSSIGDSIFWDVNGDGEQDFTDPGIPGVTVWLDTDNDGVVDAGEPTTVTDTNGRYLFTNLSGTALSPQTYQVRVLTTAGSPVNGRPQTADPDANGFACSQSANPEFPAPPAGNASVCDNRQTVAVRGASYMGADFGFKPSQVVGDRVWLDTDGDGVSDFLDYDLDGIRDFVDVNGNSTYDMGEPFTEPDSEAGIAGVRVTITCTPSCGTVTVYTDADGYYYWVPPTPTTYTSVVVSLNHTDNTNVGGALRYDSDNNGSLDASYVQVSQPTGACSGGGCNLTGASDPVSSTETDLHFDFGFTRTPIGTSTVSGTICLDNPTPEGFCGDNNADTSGTNANEAPVDLISVYLFWDNGGTLVPVAQTLTNANGDYSFGGMAASTNYVVRFATAGSPLEHMNLSSPLQSGQSEGSTYASRAITTPAGAGSSTTNQDFAFVISSNIDFGDLPVSYDFPTGGPVETTTYLTTIAQSPTGPGHIVTVPSAPVAALGASAATAVNVETNGQPSGTASLDTSDNGIQTLNPTMWTSSSVSIQYRTTGSFSGTTAWLLGWIDFDQDLQFDTNELVVNQAVANTNGVWTTITFDPPGTPFDNLNSKDLFARFRIFTSEPLLKSVAYSGIFTGGEVEDYLFQDVGTTPVTLSYFNATRTGNATHFDWSTIMETSNAGFNLYVEGANGLEKLNDELIESSVVDSQEQTDYKLVLTDIDGTNFFIEDVAVNGDTTMHGPFALGETHGARTEAEHIDWDAINAENDAKAAERAARNEANALARSQRAQNGKDKYPTYEVLVNQTGIQRISYEQLLAAGFDLKNLKSSDIAMSNRGVDMPIRVEPANGKFGPGSYIEFYGEALDTRYTATNVYQLFVDKKRAMRFGADGSALTGSPAATYMETVTLNNQRAYGEGSPFSDPYYDTTMSGRAGGRTYHFTINVEGYVPGAPATLVVNTYGITYAPQNPDHHIVFSLNGVKVEDIKFDGPTAAVANVQIPAGVLKEGANTLTLFLPFDTGASLDFIRFDNASITYPRSFTARNGALTFTAAGSQFSVSNLPSADVRVLRIEGGKITAVNASVSAANGTYTASFNGTAAAAKYVVVAQSALITPTLVAERPAADLTSGQVDLLIISHPSFIDGLQPLVAARTAQGYTVRVVNVEDVYAQFNYGIFDPSAIRSYISYAKANMGTEYVLLVGGDTSDYRNYVSTSVSFIPTMYTRTTELVYHAPADPMLADVNGDNVPDVALGRFPVRTAADLATIVNKTLAYDNKAYDNTAVIAADATFAGASDAINAGLPAGWNKQNAYLDSASLASVRSTLLNGVNNGAALTVFTGHSALERWTFSGMLNAADIGSLSNAGRPTVVVQFGCWNAYYVGTSYEMLAQKFLMSGDRGAAAVLGATALADASNEVDYGQLLMPLMTQPGMTIGEAMRLSKVQLASTNPNHLDMLLGYTLLGDPTLVVAP